MFALRFKNVSDEGGKELLEKSGFIGQRFSQLSQLLSTIIHLYRQVTMVQVKDAMSVALKVFEETSASMTSAFDSLKAKKSSLNHFHDLYFRAGDTFERETILTISEPPKDKLKALRAVKATAENAYRAEYVD
jgi:hypothetical protein